jgi:hypothetical protein
MIIRPPNLQDAQDLTSAMLQHSDFPHRCSQNPNGTIWDKELVTVLDGG